MSQYRGLTNGQDPMLNGPTTDEEWGDAQFATTSAPFDSGGGWSNDNSSSWNNNGTADFQQGFDAGISPHILSTGPDEAYLLGPSGHPTALAAGGTGMSL